LTWRHVHGNGLGVALRVQSYQGVRRLLQTTGGLMLEAPSAGDLCGFDATVRSVSSPAVVARPPFYQLGRVGMLEHVLELEGGSDEQLPPVEIAIVGSRIRYVLDPAAMHESEIPGPVHRTVLDPLRDLRSLAEVTALATGFCYLVGFVAASRHYTKFGVPVNAIGNGAFLAAGVLFAFAHNCIDDSTLDLLDRKCSIILECCRCRDRPL
jgi:hypothetical protein